jgi:RimJ/RimL family protein N-acetyltransferase
VIATELTRDDLPFLLALWQSPDVMRYADEFPRLRGWSKESDPDRAWNAYVRRRAELGPAYTQLILRLPDGTAIGESFFAPLPEGATFGRWSKPRGILCLMGDIKLARAHWGKGLGTHGMRRVLKVAFQEVGCHLFVVPPHRKNPAALRLYEKVGFVPFRAMRSWHNHKVMEMTAERYWEVTKG